MKVEIPNYDLYGEFLSGRRIDPLHHEPLRDRSSRHGWRIRPHRHERLAQIFAIRSPNADIRLGELDFQNQAPVVLLAPPGVIHGFGFTAEVAGDVVSFDAGQPGVGAVPAHPVALQDGPACDAINVLMDQLRRATSAYGIGREQVLLGVLRLMLAYLATEGGPLPEPHDARRLTDEPTRAERHVRAFCGLIEQHFATPMSVQDYAQGLGLSAPHLTRLCNRHLGTTPNMLLRMRRIAEARRLLEFTRHPIGEIALRSGFPDAGYFARSFRAATGSSASTYRRGRAKHP